MKSISIIVPVFNAAMFLPKCLDSLLAQRFQDFEIILINDGSTDCSAIVCDKYADKDSRITVTHTVNKGPGYARNTGIALSSNEWICFVDADDWCDESYLSAFIEKGQPDDDLVIQGRIWEHPGGKQEIRIPLDKHYQESGLIDCIQDNDLLNYGGPVCKLFRKTIITDNQLEFPTNFNYGEDSVFFFKYLTYCKRISCTSEAHYHYVDHSPNTLSKKVHDSISLMQFLADSLSLVKCLALERRNLVSEYNIKALNYSKRAYANMFKLRYNKGQILDAILFFQQNVRELLSTDGLNVANRSFFTLTGWPPIMQYYILCLFQGIGIIKT